MKRGRKRRGFRLRNLIPICIILYIVITFWNQRNLMKELQAKKNENIIINKELEKEIRDLEKEIESSETLEFVEKVARDELGMVKPKEIIVIDRNKNKKSFFETIHKDN